MCEDILQLMLFANAVEHAGGLLGTLTFNYLPFARQDRVCAEGDAFALEAFADLINSMPWQRVIVHDPHNEEVVKVLFRQIEIVQQHELLKPALDMYTQDFILVCPDEGAILKFDRLFVNQKYGAGAIYCTKQRDSATGALSGFAVRRVNFRKEVDLLNTPLVIVETS